MANYRNYSKKELKKLLANWKSMYKSNPEVFRDKQLAGIVKDIGEYVKSDSKKSGAVDLNSREEREKRDAQIMAALSKKIYVYSKKLAEQQMDALGDINNVRKQMMEDLRSSIKPSREAEHNRVRVSVSADKSVDRAVDDGTMENAEIRNLFKNSVSAKYHATKEFKGLEGKFAQMETAFTEFSKDKTGKKMFAYIQKLKELESSSKEYIAETTKGRVVDGKVKVQDREELETLTAAREVSQYARQKTRQMYRNYAELSVAAKLVNNISGKKVDFDSKEVKEMMNSQAFKNVIKGKSINELKEVAMDKDKLKEFTREVAKEQKNLGIKAPEKEIGEKLHKETKKAVEENITKSKKAYIPEPELDDMDGPSL